MATATALPGPAFAGRALVLKIVAADEVWRRIYETRFPNALGWGPGLNRFSDPSGNAFGVVYLGSSAKVAFVEAILRDRTDGRGDGFMLDVAEIEIRSLASIRVIEPLRLVDLSDDGRLRMGEPSDVVGASDQTLAREWSAAFHRHRDQPTGSITSNSRRPIWCRWAASKTFVAREYASSQRPHCQMPTLVPIFVLHWWEIWVLHWWEIWRAGRDETENCYAIAVAY